MGTNAILEIARLPSYAERDERFDVSLDGKVLGHLGEDEMLTIAVPAGAHALEVRWDYWGSQTVALEVGAGERRRFACSHALRGKRIALTPFVMAFARRRYLELREI